MSDLFSCNKKLPASLLYRIHEMCRSGKVDYKKSYSQCGEDMIIDFMLPPQADKKWTWLDIGAHHPTWLNNTAFFYEKGYHGINIEADPRLIQRFYDTREKDLNLNIAIADKSGTMDFYIMEASEFNTLSAEEAHRYEKLGHKIVETVSVETMSVMDVLDTYCEGIFPDFLSLDAEGYDLAILKSIDWHAKGSYPPPKMICVENIPYLPKLKNYFASMQTSDVSKYLESKNYSIIVFTLINTIFVHNEFIERA